MDDVSLAADLVREAGVLASRMLSDGLDTEYKTSISDVVSAADHAAEELIVTRLAESRPDDGLVGEEGARRSGAGRTWYVDPVDGTYNFLSRIPYWCSAIGLADADGPLVGAVYAPTLDELWVGGRDLCDHAQWCGRSRAVRPAAGRGLGGDVLPSPPPAGPVPAVLVAVRHCGRSHGTYARLGLGGPGRGGQRPSRDLPAGQPAPVGLGARRSAGARSGRRRRGGHRTATPAGRSPATARP